VKEVRSEMAGVVFRVLVQVGQEVAAGEDVVILESMKMEIPLSSPQAGKVGEVRVAVGDFVQEGQVVVTLQ